MRVDISISDKNLILKLKGSDLAPRHESQLSFWGFHFDATVNGFKCEPENLAQLLIKLTKYFNRNNIRFELNKKAGDIFNEHIKTSGELHNALQIGNTLKDGTLCAIDTKAFYSFLSTNIARQLKEHQVKAALHLLSVKNGANFSVPGSGKTTVVLVTFQRLRLLGEVDSLFVVGPPSCFGPWLSEYEEVLGAKPTYEIFAGGDIEERKFKYQTSKESACDIYLTTFQTLHNDWKSVKNLFRLHGIRFYFVVDEAHYIKQLGGAWAAAVLNVAQYAKQKCILTGTPFPKSFTDAFNLFDVLWPESPPISNEDRNKIDYFYQKNKLSEAASILDEKVGPLFYRVRKKELNLAPQFFHDPIIIKMNEYERLVYDSITDQVRTLSQSDFAYNFELLMHLIRGRMMRVRQCTSYIKLLGTAISEYDENLIGTNISLSNIIRNYDELEIPAKLNQLLDIVHSLRDQNEKIVIWSHFIETLKLIKNTLEEKKYKVQLIYGATPTQNASVSDELTREGIIREFMKTGGNIDILIANPAACAESISLHKTCSYAIYYDLSYNCAQYLQSLDRIHRVGGSETKPAHYYFLQYENSIDSDILANVQRKAANMYAIIDQDYAIYSLDMFEDDDDLKAYERLFNK